MIVPNVDYLGRCSTGISDEEFEYNWDVYCYEHLKWAIENCDEGWDYDERPPIEVRIEIAIATAREALKQDRIEYENARKRAIYEKEIDEFRTKYLELKKTAKPKLSKKSQQRIIEGNLDIVFSETRRWYHLFLKKISEETLYYVSLFALINVVKYFRHPGTCDTPVFENYVKKSIKDAIIKYLARNEHITYREAYRKLNNHVAPSEHFKLDYESHEESVEPNTFNDMVVLDSDVISDISNGEFMEAYNKALNKYSPIERQVMQLVYDSDGYRILTYEEIGFFLGISSRQVAAIKKRVIGYLQNDETLLSYKIALDGHLDTSSLNDDERRIIELTLRGLDVKLISEYTGIEIKKIAKIRSNAFKKMSIAERNKRIEEKKKVKVKEKIMENTNTTFEDSYVNDDPDDLPFL